MKKKIALFLLLAVLLPCSVHANPVIKNTRLMGPDQVEKCTNFSLTFGVNFSDLEKDKQNGQGIAGINFEIDYDKSLLILTEITSQANTWSSQLVDNQIYSLITENNYANNKCIDGILNCVDYLVTVHFYLKDTSSESTTIKIGRTNVMLLDIFDFNTEYTEEELEDRLEENLISINANQIKKITFKESGTSISERQPEPTPLIDSEKPELDLGHTVIEKLDDIQKLESNNTYLKSLQIESYAIDFRKTKKDYYIRIDEGINQLQVAVELEDEKSNYQVIGADNLKDNNYKVIVEVTAENGDKNTYTIHARVKENDIFDREVLVDEDMDSDSKLKIEKKYFIIGIVVFVFLLVLTIFIRKILDRKLDKALDEML